MAQTKTTATATSAAACRGRGCSRGDVRMGWDGGDIGHGMFFEGCFLASQKLSLGCAKTLFSGSLKYRLRAICDINSVQFKLES